MENGIFEKTTNQNSNTEKESCFTPDSSTLDITQNDVNTEEMPVEEPEACHLEEKFLVFKWQLLQLFQFCPRCHFPASTTVCSTNSCASLEAGTNFYHCRLESQNRGLVLAGDGRSDSPGLCAKYGAFTFIETKINKVLDIQQVQSNEVPNSSWCEHEGLKRSIRFLKDEGLQLDTLITDRHRQNNKWIKENLDGTNHFYDIWHVAKGTGKKLEALAKVKDCDIVGKWKQSITNHMYWSVGSTPDNNGDLIVAKWESVMCKTSTPTTRMLFSKVVFMIPWKKMMSGRLSGLIQQAKPLNNWKRFF
ncbi:uncharacterized protein LOC133203984 [Saccostrea echinata]|uniref:uncharacterized protein LOC133203984 n=1 Tax=Saccostrea echinata TaxID=191078 RepID=UPI002A815DB7|nr:uncharacterized protein LOC133203984 [Saccostrea echinata]